MWFLIYRITEKEENKEALKALSELSAFFIEAQHFN